jgi:hypothetical protein
VSLLQHPLRKDILVVKEKKINAKDEAGRQILMARQRMELQHPNLLRLVDYSIAKHQELCSSFFILKMFFEYPKSDMKRDTTERKKTGVGYSFKELTHLMYQQLGVLDYLQGKELSHGDVQPMLLAWENDAMQSRLMDRAEEPWVPAKTKQVQKNRLLSNQQLYQSPLMYQNLKKGNLNFTFDPYKEDAFALGMVLLEAGNGMPVQNVYDTKAGAVSEQALGEHLATFGNKYGPQSQELVQGVNYLCAYDETKRPSPKELVAQLPSYEQMQQAMMQFPEGGWGNQYTTTTTTTTVTEEEMLRRQQEEEMLRQQAQQEPQQDPGLFEQSGDNPYASSSPQAPQQMYEDQPASYDPNEKEYHPGNTGKIVEVEPEHKEEAKMAPVEVHQSYSSPQTFVSYGQSYTTSTPIITKDIAPVQIIRCNNLPVSTVTYAKPSDYVYTSPVTPSGQIVYQYEEQPVSYTYNQPTYIPQTQYVSYTPTNQVQYVSSQPTTTVIRKSI